MNEINSMRERLDGMESEIKDFKDLSPNPGSEPEHKNTQDGINSIPEPIKKKSGINIKLMAASLKRNRK